MSEKNGSAKKGGTPLRWMKRMFMGSYGEVKDDRYDSPSKQAVKRFFRKPLDRKSRWPPAR